MHVLVRLDEPCCQIPARFSIRLSILFKLLTEVTLCRVLLCLHWSRRRAAHVLVAEAHEPLEAGTPPNGNPLSVKGCNICAMGGPLHEELCPAIPLVNGLRQAPLCVIEEDLCLILVPDDELVSASSVYTPLVQILLQKHIDLVCIHQLATFCDLFHLVSLLSDILTSCIEVWRSELCLDDEEHVEPAVFWAIDPST